MSKPTEITVVAEEFNAIKDKVTTLETTVTEKETLLTEKDVKISELTEELSVKDTVITEKDTLIAEKDTALQEKDSTISTLTTEKGDLEGKIATLETKASELETEKQGLLDQQTEMSAKAHKDLVERVVDFKIALNKPGVENREEAISAHMERATESLKDSYNDLLNEITKGGKPYIPERLQRPGISAIPGEPHTTIEGQQETPEELDAEKVLKALFSGQFRKKN